MMTPTLLNYRYKVISTLGSGGFGDTFLAEDTQMPSGRRCVIKQLKPLANDPKIYQVVQERFQREAAILEDLGSGNNYIPTLYAYFEENGQFYLIQEYIEGQTITQKSQQGRFSESSVKEILANILPVLDYVHSKRIVHRDIKPDNIILRNSDGKPTLIDFGAVKETMGTVLTSSGNSSQSIVIGTPGFMPSEQSVGRPVYSSDLYSLGLTAIYLLTGKIPQEFTSDPATGEMMWRQQAPNVTPSFANFLDKAIQSHPRDRYKSANEMLQALYGGTNPIIATQKPAETVISSLPGTRRDTVIAAPSSRQSLPSSQPPLPSVTNNGMSDWLKTLITSSVIGSCLILGLWLTREKKATQVELQQPTQIAEPQNTSPSIRQTPIAALSTNPLKQANQAISLGWVRLGAVNNTEGKASLGEMLIPTTQPVTVYPNVVPEIGTQVTIVNAVKTRISQPLNPERRLADQKGVLTVGQKVVILNLDYFQDPTSPSPYTVMWAEVGLLN